MANLSLTYSLKPSLKRQSLWSKLVVRLRSVANDSVDLTQLASWPALPRLLRHLLRQQSCPRSAIPNPFVSREFALQAERSQDSFQTRIVVAAAASVGRDLERDPRAKKKHFEPPLPKTQAPTSYIIFRVCCSTLKKWKKRIFGLRRG